MATQTPQQEIEELRGKVAALESIVVALLTDNSDALEKMRSHSLRLSLVEKPDATQAAVARALQQILAQLSAVPRQLPPPPVSMKRGV